MVTFEEFEKEMLKQQAEFFKKNFVGKELNSALYDTLSKAIIKLAIVQTYFGMILESLRLIRNEKAIWNNLNFVTKKHVKESMQGIENICKDLDAILIPICDGLSK